ncbi:hypothetical protein ABZ646_21985 [Streptomyces sp. NPDC007162]|uniref:hypothetical protein n=1 Tax=Streptomyces sp. NPDC007162 TaxID=3156917 RepID=UPI0033F41562
MGNAASVTSAVYENASAGRWSATSCDRPAARTYPHSFSAKTGPTQFPVTTFDRPAGALAAALAAYATGS